MKQQYAVNQSKATVNFPQYSIRIPFAEEINFLVFDKSQLQLLPDKPGVYLFCRLSQSYSLYSYSQGFHAPIYIGVAANSLSARLAWHERWAEAEQLGANRILVAQVAPAEQDRVRSQLINKFNSELNRDCRPSPFIS